MIWHIFKRFSFLDLQFNQFSFSYLFTGIVKKIIDMTPTIFAVHLDK